MTGPALVPRLLAAAAAARALPAAAAVAVALALGAGAGAAADRLDRLACPDRPVRLVVVGDSLADGLWGALARAFLRCAAVEVLRLTAVSDGLARSAPDDWLARYTTTPASGEADIVVVQIGANDITSIRQGSRRAVFDTPEWDTLYEARARALAEGLAARAAQVLWLGLPVVGAERLEPAYRAVTALQAAGAGPAVARFLDIHALTGFGSGGFTMNAEVDGSLRQLRAADQVHFTEAGYDAVAGALGPDLARAFAARRAAGSAPAVALQ
ncbi:MAG: DUF459 domain-containing protein [Rhodobacteraceae bacterium]|nr:DUF459 domain-containing protein [Paracoccaceae bacterium]